MSHTFNCYSLFDITPTGVMLTRKPDQSIDPNIWLYKRNTQCNFDTILQAISLRSQPEDISIPEKINIELDGNKFGFLLSAETPIPCWKFNFTVQSEHVFNDGIYELGALYRDCDKIPMILCNTEWNELVSNLDGTPELRNIYFEKH